MGGCRTGAGVHMAPRDRVAAVRTVVGQDAAPILSLTTELPA